MDEKDQKKQVQQDAFNFVFEEMIKMVASASAGKLASEEISNDLNTFIEKMCEKYGISKQEISDRFTAEQDNIVNMADEMYRDMIGQIKTVQKTTDKKED